MTVRFHLQLQILKNLATKTNLQIHLIAVRHRLGANSTLLHGDKDKNHQLASSKPRKNGTVLPVTSSSSSIRGVNPSISSITVLSLSGDNIV